MHDIHITPNDSLRSVQSGPIRSYSVYSVLFYPFWSIWSYLVLFSPIRSSLLLFGPFGHVQSATIFFSPFCHLQSLLGSVGPYGNVLSYLVHSVLFGLTMFCQFLFGPLRSLLGLVQPYLVFFNPLGPLLFSLIRSCSVMLGPIQSNSVLFGLIWSIRSCLLLFSQFGPIRLIWSQSVHSNHFVFLIAHTPPPPNTQLIYAHIGFVLALSGFLLMTKFRYKICCSIRLQFYSISFY